MPAGDGTGPLGLGPMTGRGAGYCAGYPVTGYINPIPGFWGWGRGWSGRGRGWRHWYYLTGLPGWARTPASYVQYPGINPQDELNILKNQAQVLKEQLEGIENRIKVLEKKENTNDE